jgi:hypothetical protein
MGLLDKAKQQAQDLRGKVEGKVDDVQSKRHLGDLLEQLGRLAYAEQTGRAASDSDAEIAKVMEALRSAEAEGATIVAPAAAPAADEAGTPAAGDASAPPPPPPPPPPA